jgi:hypothetical protein
MPVQIPSHLPAPALMRLKSRLMGASLL